MWGSSLFLDGVRTPAAPSIRLPGDRIGQGALDGELETDPKTEPMAFFPNKRRGRFTGASMSEGCG